MEFPRHLDEESEGSQPYPLNQSQPYTCAKGHRSSLSLPTQSDGRICLVCLATLLSDPHSLSLHLSFALSNLSLALRCDRSSSSSSLPNSFVASLRTCHPHLLVGPLVRALASACDRADDELSKQVSEVVLELTAALDASVVEDFLARISDMLCKSGSLIRQLHTLHCFGVLLSEFHDSISTTSIRDKYTLFSKLLDGLQLPSEELRGEILFVLYKLSSLQASPWDDDEHDVYDNGSCGIARLSSIGELSLRHSLNVLLKTQSDDVRLNCIALLLVLAKRDIFNNLLIKDCNSIGAREERDSTDSSSETMPHTPITSLLADAVKGSLLSSSTEVQAGALELISHFLLWGPGHVGQIEAFIEENIADYIFEVLRLSGKNDALVISCIEVLSLLSTADDSFKQKLAIGFQTILSVLHYVAEIPYHPVQPHVLKLVLSCVTFCTGIMSPHQTKGIAATLTQLIKSHSSGDLGMHMETFVLACLIFVEILKSQSACEIKELPLLVKEASKHALSSIFSSHEASDTTLLLHSLYILKEALVYSHEGNTLTDISNEKISLETSIVETCEVFLLPWLQNDIQDEDALLGVLELFHMILLNGSIKSASGFARLLASSSWFNLSFGFLGVFPGESLRSMVYMIHSLVVDQILGVEFGDKIRDVCLLLPSDPLDLLCLLGQKCLFDFNLASRQHAVLVLLYITSLYGNRIADETETLASLEQYILLNSSNSSGQTDCMLLTQIILLYSSIRGTLSMHQAAYSQEAEKTVFNLITYQEWDLLSMQVDPVALRWLFRKQEITEPLSYQILNFCRSNSNNSTCMQLDKIQSTLDLQTIAELAITGDNHFIAVLLLILDRVIQTGQEADALHVMNVINEIIRVFPESSNQFCLCGIVNALNSLCGAFNSSETFEACSITVFDILYSASYKSLCDEEDWLALTLKLLKKLENLRDSQLLVQQENILLGIFCLILHYSTRQVLQESSKAVILNGSLISLMDRVVQEACAKGPALSEHSEETPLGESLVFVLLLSFFSLRSLHAILKADIDWQEFFQSGTDSHSTSVLGIPCHELCKILRTGSSLSKIVSSQCLAELFNQISAQRMHSKEGLKCSPRYLQSIIAVMEGFIFHENGIVSRNCGSILAIILGWENKCLRDCSNRWCRLIAEELVVGLGTASGLSSKGFASRQEGLVGIVVSLLKWKTVPVWIGKMFQNIVVSGIINHLTARNVTGEIVKLFRELMTRNYLTQEHVTILHHLFQICRRQLYDESEVNQLDEENGKMTTGCEDGDKLWTQLIHLMLNQSKDCEGSRVRNKKLLDEIDLFFHESRKQSQTS
ncbi:Protein PRD1 [Rhynchospora pubera]|uniref:Protein PRD1 n=1 Tax=Rhynchospora pubera TaxID=906938 RepID=A0AAV8FH81_9POAL|nr:Protein PRD1 [Rhynchospora pubera]